MQPRMPQCLNFYVFILVGTFDPETSVWVHVILNTKLQTTGIQKSAYSFALHLNINNNCWMAFIFCTQG